MKLFALAVMRAELIMRYSQGTVQICLHSQVELLSGDIGNVRDGILFQALKSLSDERRGRRETDHDTGIVDENIDLATLLDDTIDDLLASFFVPNVLGEK